MRTEKVTSYASISMLLSLIETMLPHPIPFLRYGLSNIPLLAALSELGSGEFLSLTLLKGITVSLLSGTLFSPIGIMSIAQSLGAGITMLLLHKASKEAFSLWGISLAGAYCSTLLQVIFSSLWLGRGVISLLPWMLIFSLLSGLLTAWLAMKMPRPGLSSVGENGERGKSEGLFPLLILIAVLTSSSFMRNISMLSALFLTGMAMMLIQKKKLMLLPWINIFILSILSAVLTPLGEVLFRLFSFPVTRDALMSGVVNALRISSAVAWSLALSGKIRMGGIIGSVFSLFAERQKAFFSAEGKLTERAMKAITLEE